MECVPRDMTLAAAKRNAQRLFFRMVILGKDEAFRFHSMITNMKRRVLETEHLIDDATRKLLKMC